jgi:hypothetical protein
MISTNSSRWAAKQADAAAFKEYDIGISYGDDAPPQDCIPINIKQKRRKEDEGAYGTLLYGDAGSAPKSGTAGRDQKVNF